MMRDYSPPYTLTSQILKLTAAIAEAVTKLELNGAAGRNLKLRKTSRIRTIAGTLAIEGNELGEERITALLEGKRVLGTVREIAEAEGAIRAYEATECFDETRMEDLLEAHRLMMGGVLESAGRFRHVDVGVGGNNGVSHIAPPHDRVPELMAELFGWLKENDEHPLIKSCVFHYEFEFIHPFGDGNGRMGRFWQSLMLYRWKPIFAQIPIESVVRDHQKAYYEALEAAGSAGESTPFIAFMLAVILESVESSVKSSVKSSVNTEERILRLLQENPTTTIGNLAEILGLSTRAVEKQIAKLKKEGRLKRIGSARKGRWEVVEP